jgi:hypothetical protein
MIYRTRPESEHQRRSATGSEHPETVGRRRLDRHDARKRPSHRAFCSPALPTPVYKQIMDLYDFVGGYGHLVMIGRSGFMTHAETEKSISLFAREVLPRLKVIAPVEAGFNQR